MTRLRAWWRRLRARRLAAGDFDSGEICRTCFKDLTVGECWERREHLPNTEEMGTGGGTFMTGYWCPEHRPDDAVRLRA